MSQLSSHQFTDMYKELGIDVTELGCVMLDVEPIHVLQMVENAEDDLYFTKDPKKFWIKGAVAEKTAHATLMYGLLEHATKMRKYINRVLKDWTLRSVEVESVGKFDSQYPDEPYYCVVAHLKVTPRLLEGNERLKFLPHINTFAGYKPHITLAYIKKDDKILNKWTTTLGRELKGRRYMFSDKLNLGSKK